VPLGDIARALRRQKAASTSSVVDNDNLAEVMEQVENERLKGGLRFTFDNTGKSFQMSSSPDVTCSLSFNANMTSLLTDPFVPRDLQEGELSKLTGPATIEGDTLQVAVYNGTTWNVKEIIVGLTILRREDAHTAYYGNARLVPASAENAMPLEKHSDLTVLYHLKGTATPFTTTVFHETLGALLTPDQEWHWAIVQAKGIPPSGDVPPQP